MWQSYGDHSVWTGADFSAAVDLARPAEGLQALRIQGRPVAILRPLQLIPLGSANGPSGAAGSSEPAAILRDGYVREHDLVATYADSDADQVVPQVYWRMVDPAVRRRIAALEVIISVQTSLLDGTAAVQVFTDMGPGEMIRYELDAEGHVAGPTVTDRQDGFRTSRPALTLFRPAGLDWSYGEMVFPTDLCDLQLTALDGPPGWNRLASSLFAERLEKGVIRRGRMRGAWLPRHDDAERLRAEYLDFLHAPLPLTT